MKAARWIRCGQPATRSLLLCLLVSLLILTACGGPGGSGGIVVTIISVRTTVPIGSSLVLGASVTGCTVCTVTWSLAVGDPGALSSPGPSIATTYTAPFAVPAPDTITVTATSVEDPSKSVTLIITILEAFTEAPFSPFGLGTGTNPQALTIGEFNGDANLDVVTANLDTADVSILLGDGTGSLAFNAAVSTSGTDPVSLAQGLFDADAPLDVAVVNFSTDDVAILSGDGAGSFSPATCDPPFTNCTVGTSPQFVAAGDFDNPPDGFDDLAVANFFSSDITILMSNGDGSFTTTQTITLTGSGPWAIATGLIDGDGNPDLAVADLTGDDVWVILGNGDGTFQTSGISPVEIPLTAGTGPAAIAIDDFDGDTFADLAVVNQGTAGASCPPSGNPDTVTVMLGLGDGTFYPPTTNAVGSNPRAIAVGDFNQDGAVDLVTANFCGNSDNGSVSVLFGKGDGTFQSAVESALGLAQYPTGIAVGDLDNDGFNDVAVTDSGTDSVSVLLNNN